MQYPKDRRANLLHYTWHFAMLVVIGTVLAVAGPWRLQFGLAGSFAIYGGLHAMLLAICLRRAESLWRRCCFVALGSIISMANAALCIMAARLLGGVAGRWVAVTILTVGAAVGAGAYVAGLRHCFGARLPLRARLSIVAACAAATLIVFAAGLHAAAGGFGIAAAWWAAMSLGLGWQDLCGRVTLDR